jgi:hypothetical protein
MISACDVLPKLDLSTMEKLESVLKNKPDMEENYIGTF